MVARRCLRWTAVWLIWLYGLFVLAIAVAMRWFGDQTWWGSVILFSPRWLWAIPWPIGFVVSLVLGRWKTRIVALSTAVVLVFWVLGFVIPWTSMLRRGRGEPIRVLTCNLGGKLVDYQLLRKLLEDVAPQIAAFEESDRELDDNLPPGWNSIRAGEIVVASRSPMVRKAVVVQPLALDISFRFAIRSKFNWSPGRSSSMRFILCHRGRAIQNLGFTNGVGTLPARCLGGCVDDPASRTAARQRFDRRRFDANDCGWRL